jgi:hypothetical protein
MRIKPVEDSRSGCLWSVAVPAALARVGTGSARDRWQAERQSGGAAAIEKRRDQDWKANGRLLTHDLLGSVVLISSMLGFLEKPKIAPVPLVHHIF